jgi:RNA polymerase sigma-70 factor (ECF subfamily)
VAAPRTLVHTDSLSERFEALLQQHRRIVFKVAATYCAHREDRRDLAQEISVQLWRAFPSYDPSRPFTTWMYRVALNVAISFVRQSGRHNRHTTTLDADVLENVPADEDPEPDERVRVLHQVIGQLDDLHRALVLLYLDERSYSDIADVLGISETNVATKLNRLKQRMRTTWNSMN